MNIKPLANKKIITTRPVAQSQKLVVELTSLGATVFNLPTIKIVDNILNSEQISLLHNLNQFDLIVFSSANGVNYFIKHLQQQNIELAKIKSKSVACIGEETKKVAEQNGLSVRIVPQNYDAKTLSQTLNPQDLTILIPGSTIALNDLPLQLIANGATVITLPVYQTVSDEEYRDQLNLTLNNNHIDYIIFASPSAVQSFLSLITPDLRKQVVNTYIIAIGPTTAQSAQAYNFKSVYTAKTHTSEGIITILKELHA